MTHSLTSVMGLTTNPFSGRVTLIRVCANCETERAESSFVQAYARAMKCGRITHGVCVAHYQSELLKLKVG